MFGDGHQDLCLFVRFVSFTSRGHRGTCAVDQNIQRLIAIISRGLGNTLVRKVIEIQDSRPSLRKLHASELHHPCD